MTYIYQGTEWTSDKIQRVYEECCIIGQEELKLDWYPNEFHLVGYEQMLDVYASHGMPLMYNHWSFGKSYLQNYNLYKTGYMGLALEMVINSVPCINYLLDENTMTGQALVIAHAAIGHNSFFKNNYLFKEWTMADFIVDYLAYAKSYIAKCEEKYGPEQVEAILDCAHSLMNHGVDKYKRPSKSNSLSEEDKRKKRQEDYEKIYDEIWGIVPDTRKVYALKRENQFLPNGPEENLLYFLEKKSPILKPWQREILRIVRKIATYFKPQLETKNINEGWASTVHYYIMNRLYDKGLIDEGSMLEFLKLHTSVVFQPEYDKKYYSGFNPYHLGFSIFADIKRMSENPTEEDKYWFPTVAGGDWVENWNYAYQNFRDESFIQQFLSPKVIRDMKLFELDDYSEEDAYLVTNIHNERGYKEIRKTLASSTAVSTRIPDIQITHVSFETRECTLTHFSDNHSTLSENEAIDVLYNFEYLWGFNCKLRTQDRTNGFVIKEYTDF